MNSPEILKSFVAHAKEFHVNNSEEVVNNLQRCVNILGASSDVCQFDPGSKEVVEFFINLHELMIALDPRSNLTWTCLSVIREACRNQAMRDALMNTYKFTPILAKILQAQQSLDKRLLILSLLQELTYGIKISWQESFLKQLVALLTSWINGPERELSALALGVLINLCYKNLPAIYTLMTTVDTKKFLRALLNSQTNDLERMQVCKLLITLESVSGSVPGSEMRSYVKLTGSTLTDAIKSNNVYLARHIFNYFQEIMKIQPMKNLIDDQLKFANDVGNLLDVLKAEDKISVDCVSVGLEFMCVIVDHIGISGGASLLSEFPKAVNLALRWVRTQGVSVHALNFITKAISCFTDHKLMDCGDSSISETENTILQLIGQQLEVILLLLDHNKEGMSTFGSEAYAKQSALLRLLTRIIEVPILASKLAQSLNHQMFHEIFAPLSMLTSTEGSNIFEPSIFSFYVQALTFLTALGNFDISWFNLLQEKLKEKQVNMVLAVAIYNGSDKVKRQVLGLLTAPAFPQQQLDKLSECLMDMNKLMVYAAAPNGCTTPTQHSQMSPVDMNHLLTISQEGYLNSLLERFEKSLSENNRGVTSGVMELYQYKMASMSHAMRVMQSSQDAADMRITKLQHCLAMTSSEVSRLHHLLHASEQASEIKAKNLDLLTTRIQDAEKEATKWKNKFAQIDQTVKSKTRIIEEQEQELKVARVKLASLEESVEKLTVKINADTKTLKELRNELETSKKVLGGKNELISSMERDIAVKNELIKKLEISLDSEQQEAAKLKQQLQMILELAASAKK